MAAWERESSRPRTPELLGVVAAALGVSAKDLLVPVADPSLRWMRFAAGLDIPAVAGALHLSEPTLRRWEARGVRGVGEATVARLAEVLGAEPDAVAAALRPR